MKFHGKIGFWKGDIEVRPGVWIPQIDERMYTGDIFKNSRYFQYENNQQNPNLNVSNQFSILADLYMKENLDSIRYILWNGIKWSVTRVSIDYPRVTFEVGGVYNGQEQVGVS